VFILTWQSCAFRATCREHNCIHGFTTNRCYYFSFSKKRATKWFGCVVQDQPSSHNYFDSFMYWIAFFWMTGKMTTEVFNTIYRLFCKTYHRYRLNFDLFGTFHNGKIPPQWIQTKTKMWLVFGLVQRLTKNSVYDDAHYSSFLPRNLSSRLSWITILNKRKIFVLLWPIRLQKK
jgi:hypothetical protein